MLNTILRFRQVTPSEDNAAARSLSEENQMHNMNLVAVNARVTFVVWILETIANISVLILWQLVYGTTTFGTLTNSMIWYYLIISYTFLMNTSYNKDRIIEDGWKMIIMNALKSILYRMYKINNYFSTPSATNFLSNQSNVKTTTMNEPENKEVYKRHNLEQVPSNSSSYDHQTGSTNSSQNTKLDRASKLDIFVISRPELEHFPIAHTSKFKDLTIEDLEQLSITIRKDQQATSNHEVRPLSPGSSTDSEYMPSDCNQQISYRVQKGREILAEMQKQLSNEKAYLHYFEQLMEFARLFNHQSNSPFKEYTIEPFITFPSTHQSKIKNKKIHNQRKIAENTKEKSKTIAVEQSFTDQKSLSERFERKQLRLGMLNNITSNFTDENDYNDFVNNLINLEEGLITE